MIGRSLGIIVFKKLNKTDGIVLCLDLTFELWTVQGGGRVLDLMNNYSGSYNLMIIALFEIICLCYVYGKIFYLI